MHKFCYFCLSRIYHNFYNIIAIKGQKLRSFLVFYLFLKMKEILKTSSSFSEKNFSVAILAPFVLGVYAP